MRIDFEITDALNGKKIYHALKGPMKLSGRLITRLKNHNAILLNNRPARTIDRVSSGDVVSVIIEFSEESFIKPEAAELSILYEDEYFLAVNKSPHMPAHPSAGHSSGTLAQAVLGYYEKQGLSIKVRPINRLDKDTSGVTLFAGNSYIQDQIIRQMKENRVFKAYLGIVHGVYEPPQGSICLPIARKAGSVIERMVDPSGNISITHYKTLEVHSELSLVQFVLDTGRTHQIRVHSSAMGHAILGDRLYSDIPTDLIDRQALHSSELSFDHPVTGERIRIIAPLPNDMKKVLADRPTP